MPERTMLTTPKRVRTSSNSAASRARAIHWIALALLAALLLLVRTLFGVVSIVLSGILIYWAGSADADDLAKVTRLGKQLWPLLWFALGATAVIVGGSMLV